MAGYSGTPLVKKLGVKENFNAAFVNPPPGFQNEIDLPPGVKVNSRSHSPLNFVLLFITSQRELEKKFSIYAAKLDRAGMFWVSWPKKSSGVATDLNENVVRDIGLAKGMVDVKVCAIDHVWSGLKFVFRLKDRAALKLR
jgi:hypothetical protein